MSIGAESTVSNRRAFIKEVGTLVLASAGLPAVETVAQDPFADENPFAAMRTRPPAEQILWNEVNPRIDPETFYPGLKGEIRFVKSLDPKEWRAALQKKGPALIVPLVGGILDLGGKPLSISGGNITLLGQFASSPIVIIGGETRIQCSDVRIEHLSFRPGDRNLPQDKNYNPKEGKGEFFEPDALSIWGQTDNSPASARVLIYHCDMMWGVDENASVTGKIKFGRDGAASDVLFYRCLFAQPLQSCPTHSKYDPTRGHGCGLLIYDFAQRIGVRECVFADNPLRNPMIKGNATALIERCVISNPQGQIIKIQPVKEEYISARKEELFGAPLILVRETLCMKGPNTPDNRGVIETLESFDGRVIVRVDANVLLERGRTPNNTGRPITANSKTQLTAIGAHGLAPMGNDQVIRVLRDVLRNTGSHPNRRDLAVGELLIGCLSGEGRYINSQNDVGGYLKVARGPQRQDNNVKFPTDEHGRLKMIIERAAATLN